MILLLKILLFTILLIFVSLIIIILFFTIRFIKGKNQIKKEWDNSNFTKFRNPEEVNKLEIIPLIDWYTSNDDLIGEAGVSYLIKTDDLTILFDLGLNLKKEDPSPLLKNMNKLNIQIENIDIIYISHNHIDHVGGFEFSKRNTFSLTSKQIKLNNIKVYTPVKMHYPDIVITTNKYPFIISKGIISIGVISNFDFIGGKIEEQALAINVKNKGIILIIGCGHQSIQKIIKRTKMLFDVPIYGIIGGLHYPVSDSRIKIVKIPAQKFIGTCRYPWKSITLKEVRESINYLNQNNIKFVALSGHDSCDKSIEEFKNNFKNTFKLVKVGKKIII